MKFFCKIFILILLGVHTIAQAMTELRIDGSTIYTTSIQLSDGKTAYFGFELIIDQDRSNRWRKYKNKTTPYTTSYRGLFHVIFATGISPTLYDQYQESLEEFGFTNTQNHRDELWNLILSVPQDKAKSMAEAMSGIASGCLGFHTSIDDYIAYISKEPITGFFPLPISCPFHLKTWMLI